MWACALTRPAETLAGLTASTLTRWVGCRCGWQQDVSFIFIVIVTQNNSRLSYHSFIIITHSLTQTINLSLFPAPLAQPVYTFGSGLSYTQFQYQNSSYPSALSLHRISTYLRTDGVNKHTSFNAPQLEYLQINVTNVGAVAGSDVVLAFVVPPPVPGESGAPIKTLIGFERVFLQPGQSAVLQFPVTPNDLSYVGVSGQRVSHAGVWKVLVGEPAALEIPITVV